MAIVEFDTALLNSRHITRLAFTLGISRAEAKGLMLTFLCRVLEHQPDGMVDGFDDVDFAALAEHHLTHSIELMDAFFYAGLLDGDGDDCRVIPIVKRLIRKQTKD